MKSADRQPPPRRWLWRWRRWLPWRLIVSQLAHEEGFLDPFTVLARVRRFAQPTEVDVPTELLRAGTVMHARGLMNSQAIQHNLDWLWPYWAVRQFSPHDDAFIPWAFSVAHINLTHRNWTALGLPDLAVYPLVDPRGLLTPLLDGWSLDCWIVTADGRWLVPARLPSVEQRLDWEGDLAVTTRAEAGALALTTQAAVPMPEHGRAFCRLRVEARSDAAAWLVVSLRPYNPEGVSFIHDIAVHPDRRGWQVNRDHAVRFDAEPQRLLSSQYRDGDVSLRLPRASDGAEPAACDVGMATAAALFPLTPGQARAVTVEVPLEPPRKGPPMSAATWADSLRGHAALEVPDARTRFLYDAAVRTLVLHSPGEVFPGPYTYRRFWFRDAAFILHALTILGLTQRAERALDQFPARQLPNGYFLSQDGEWDANGQALWILREFCRLAGRPMKPAWRHAIERGARWIGRKRLPETGDPRHAGLLPAGFSAEHLGPSDFYYWDDFWGVAGLRAAADAAEESGEGAQAEAWRREADGLLRCIHRSLQAACVRLGRDAMPASPTRRLDAGAIGSLVAGYPLQLVPPDDSRLAGTVEFLLQRCFVQGGFFQTMSHAGINQYLTLHVAQVLLRAGDARCLALTQRMADLASPTGQWPEAIHPRTGGGCMGDGQHVWAAAEWALMLRNAFVREEGERLVLASGLPPAWLEQPLRFGPTLTRHGPITVEIEPSRAGGLRVGWRGQWRGQPPAIDVRLLGHGAVQATPGQDAVELKALAA
jgi:hypothetical protein